MGFLSTVVMAALLAAGMAEADRAWPDQGVPPEGTITREWVWSDGETTTTFTATGPEAQVNALDPRNAPLECEGCLLASSVQYGAADEAQ